MITSGLVMRRFLTFRPPAPSRLNENGSPAPTGRSPVNGGSPNCPRLAPPSKPRPGPTGAGGPGLGPDLGGGQTFTVAGQYLAGALGLRGGHSVRSVRSTDGGQNAVDGPEGERAAGLRRRGYGQVRHVLSDRLRGSRQRPPTGARAPGNEGGHVGGIHQAGGVGQLAVGLGDPHGYVLRARAWSAEACHAAHRRAARPPRWPGRHGGCSHEVGAGSARHGARLQQRTRARVARVLFCVARWSAGGFGCAAGPQAASRGRRRRADGGSPRRPDVVGVTRPTSDVARPLRRQPSAKADGYSGFSDVPSTIQDHLARALHKGAENNSDH